MIFDLDGVLVDSEPLYERAFGAYLDSRGRGDQAELFRITIGRRQADFLPELAVALGAEEDELARGLGAALDPLLDRIEPMPGAAEAVAALRADGRAVALATSSIAGFAAEMLRWLGIEGMFDARVTGEEVERGKPDPTIYLLAAARLGVEPGSCVAIEDAPAGVAAAKAAGMSCIAVPAAADDPTGLHEADALVTDLAAAVAEVRRLDEAPARAWSGAGGAVSSTRQGGQGSAPLSRPG